VDDRETLLRTIKGNTTHFSTKFLFSSKRRGGQYGLDPKFETLRNRDTCSVRRPAFL
jgi:hypothetical protein